MTAIEAYILSKNIALGAVSGIANITLNGTQLVFQFNDGSSANMTIPLPKDGVTPHIGANGNWFIDTTDTGIPATGPIGPGGLQGPDGKSAYDIAVTEGFSGTEEEWIQSLIGVSITGLTIDEDNHLICKLSDGSIIDAGELPICNCEGSGGVVKVDTYDNLPSTGKSDVLYITADTNTVYYWDNEYKAITAGTNNTDIGLATNDDIDSLFEDTESDIGDKLGLATEADIDSLFE